MNLNLNPTLLLYHPLFLEHALERPHPECPARYKAIMSALEEKSFDDLKRICAPKGTWEDVERAHSPTHILELQSALSPNHTNFIDPETYISPHSLEAALYAIGGALFAVDEVINQKAKNAFVVARPPGHHAEKEKAMGFCLLNTVAIAALYAKSKWGIKRVAILDFDVHHGNGTQDIFYESNDVLYASTHESPQFPGTGQHFETGAFHTIHNHPLRKGTSGETFLKVWSDIILPKVEEFAPELILLSAGFDAHIDDPLGGLELTANDFATLTRLIKNTAQKCCAGALVSVLEGGYDLNALSQSVAQHIKVLMEPQ